MVRINLLPWREQLREERRKRFVLALVGVLVIGFGAILLADQYIGSAFERQAARNEYVRKEIALLDARIEQISELQARRKQLLERMRIIQGLQGNRPIGGLIFDQLARTLPDGVYFSEVMRAGKVLSISGSAESNSQVSALLRNLEASPWLEAPSLAEVKAAGTPGVNLANVFQVTVRQARLLAEGGVK